MEIEIVKFFQNLMSSFNDVFFGCITKLGEETIFLLIFAIIYLCYSKKFAIKYSFYYLFSVAINSFLKLIIKRPRPYVASTDVSDRLHANGYSFPSGHTQGYFVQTTTLGIEINDKCKKNYVKLPTFILLLLVGIGVMVSRMYWGQHYLSDVVVGMMFGLTIPFILDWFLFMLPEKLKAKFSLDGWYAFIGIVSAVLFVLMLILQFSVGIYSNTVYKVSGVFVAFSIGYFVDKKFVFYEPNVGVKLGILKLITIIATMFLLYFVLSIMMSINSYVYFIVYLFLGLICSIIFPIIFIWIFKKRNKNG